MDTQPSDIELLINHKLTNVKTWRQTISCWANNTLCNFTYLVKSSSLLAVIIGIMNTLNVLSTKASLNEEWDWKEILQQTIDSEIIEVTAFSLIISEIKNALTNYANSQLKKIWCAKTEYLPLSELNEEQVKEKIDFLKTIINFKNDKYIPFLEKFNNILETKGIKAKQPEPQTCTYDSPTIACISKEVFNISTPTLGFTIGTLFSSSSNIIQTEIAAGREFEFWIFYSTLFTLENLLVSAGAFFVFRIKFEFTRKIFENLQKIGGIKSIYNYFNTKKNTLTMQKLTDISDALKNIDTKELEEIKIILININRILDNIIKVNPEVETILNETKSKWYINLASNIKHFSLWGLTFSAATLLDSFYGIIKTQIIDSDTSNKNNTKLHASHENPLLNTVFNNTNTSHTNIDFLNALKILISLPNLSLAVIGQVVFMIKMKITDWCGTMLENSHLYKSINKGWTYIANYCSSNNNDNYLNQGQLQEEINKLEALFTNIFKLFEKSKQLFDKLNVEKLNIEQINKLSDLKMKLECLQSNYNPSMS